MIEIRDSILKNQATLGAALNTINSSAGKIALVVDDNDRLIGTVTDGDIRRALLKGATLADPIDPFMNQHPRTAPVGHDKDELLAFMRQEQVRHVPVVDKDGKLVGLATLAALVTLRRRSNAVVLMAGGQGQRLRPLTEELPKPMLQVGPKPILETIISAIAKNGFENIFISVNYKAGIIERYFGNGRQFGVKISYLREREPLGTAGALSLLPALPTEPILIMNGDILTNISFSELIDFHQSANALATMCVRDYSFQVPYGVVDIRDGRIYSITEKPSYVSVVNAGIYVVGPEALQYVPSGRYFTMPELFGVLLGSGKPCSTWPIRDYWLDIGRHDDLAQANRDFVEVFR